MRRKKIISSCVHRQIRKELQLLQRGELQLLQRGSQNHAKEFYIFKDNFHSYESICTKCAGYKRQ